jgi:hypothetical protein
VIERGGGEERAALSETGWWCGALLPYLPATIVFPAFLQGARTDGGRPPRPHRAPAMSLIWPSLTVSESVNESSMVSPPPGGAGWTHSEPGTCPDCAEPEQASPPPPPPASSSSSHGFCGSWVAPDVPVEVVLVEAGKQRERERELRADRRTGRGRQRQRERERESEI